MSIIEGKVILGGITIIKMTVVIEKAGYIITISQKILIKIQNIKAVLSRNNFLYIGRKQLDKKGYYDPMIKLTQKKIDWIIKEKKKGRGTSEIASIMKITPRCHEKGLLTTIT